MTQSSRPASERDETRQAGAAAADEAGRVGKYGGDDGALEHERATAQPEGSAGTAAAAPGSGGKAGREGQRP